MRAILALAMAVLTQAPAVEPRPSGAVEDLPPLIVAQSRDETWHVRYWAVRELGKYGAAGVPILAERLEDADARVRRMTAETIEHSLYDLVYLRADDVPLERLEAYDPDCARFVRTAAAWAECKDVLLARLRAEESADVRNALALAIHKLAKALPQDELRSEMTRALGDSSYTVRFWAARTLARTDPRPWLILRRAYVDQFGEEPSPAAKLDAREEIEARLADRRRATNTWWEYVVPELPQLLARAERAGDEAEWARLRLDLMAQRAQTDCDETVEGTVGWLAPLSSRIASLKALRSAGLPSIAFAHCAWRYSYLDYDLFEETAAVLADHGDEGPAAMILGLENWHGGGAWRNDRLFARFADRAEPLIDAVIADWRMGGIVPQRIEREARRLQFVGAPAIARVTEATFDLDACVQLAAIAALERLADDHALDRAKLEPLLAMPDPLVVEAARKLLEKIDRRSK